MKRALRRRRNIFDVDATTESELSVSARSLALLAQKCRIMKEEDELSSSYANLRVNALSGNPWLLRQELVIANPDTQWLEDGGSKMEAPARHRNHDLVILRCREESSAPL